MTATDELRRLLDERGVEWLEATPCKTKWRSPILGGPVAAREWNGEMVLDTGYVNVTPEQAIAATLGVSDATPTRQGVGTCHNVSKIVDKYGQARFACSECGAWIDSRMLWNPECRNGESPWVKDCKLNYCPNCGARVVEVDS